MNDAVLLCTAFLALVTAQNRCVPSAYPPPGIPAKPLDSRILLHRDFQATVVVTNWNERSLVSRKEAHIKDQQFIYSQSSTSSFLYTTIRNNAVVYNFTTSSCEAKTSPPSLPIPADLFEMFNKTAPSNAPDLVSNVISLAQEKNGYLLNETTTESGIDGVEFLLCFNKTDKVEGFAVIVTFAGDKSVKPFGGLENPLPLSIRLMHLKNTTIEAADNVQTDVTISFSSFDSPNKDDSLFKLPDGVICTGLPASSPNLNTSFPNNFTATIKYIDAERGQTNVELLYAPPILSVSAAPLAKYMPIFGEDGVPETTRTIVHDFYSGYETQFSAAGSCLHLGAINGKAIDVADDGGAFVPTSAAGLFVPTNAANWSRYDDRPSPVGTLTVFRGTYNSDVNIEVLMNGVSLYKVTHFKKMDSTWKPSLSYESLILSSDADKSRTDLVSNCYSLGANSTFAFTFKQQTLQTLGSSAKMLASAIQKFIDNIVPISPERIRVAFAPTQTNGLLAVLSFADARNEQAAPVKRHRSESLVNIVIQKLNETITKGDVNINFSDITGKSQEFIILGNSLTTFPPPIVPPTPPKPAFEGYTGSAMFVLGVFMFLFGVGIGAGGLFFATRRQRISTLAYQVFE